MGVALQLVNIEIFRKDQFTHKTRKSSIIRVIKEGFFDVEGNPAIGGHQLESFEESSRWNISKT